MADRRYRAFISYSHRDKRIANWLHSALETYRLPSKAVAEGKPARLHPIFKDREELPAADSLGEAIEQAIRCSDALIVLCSPAAAQSPWIAREIDLYKRINGDHGVFPVIVEGDPPGNFPAPLLQRYENGEPTGEAAEPIAADLRRHADGRKLGKLKLVAGLAGVDLDGLVQRDAARRQRRLALVAAASVAGMVGTSGLALYAIDQRNDAREQRAEADGLIEYMLTDLRKQLEPVGRLEVLDGVGRRAMDYYARQKLADLSDGELGRRARATILVAEVQNSRGNNDAALPAFREAARTTETLLARDPDDAERMFNHGQSLFWVGYIAYQHGKLDEARKAMSAYADISTRLAKRDPGNLDWQLEEAYSQSNLGTMEFEQGRPDLGLGYFRRSAQIFDRVSKAKGRPAEQELETADAFAWVASSYKRIGRFRDAIESRRRELSIYRSVLEGDPQHNGALRQQLAARSALGELLAETGGRKEGLELLDAAIAEAETQQVLDPENTHILEVSHHAFSTRALLHWANGDSEAAEADFARVAQLLSRLRALDGENVRWAIVFPANLRLTRALTDRSDLHPQALRQLVADARGRLDPAVPDSAWSLVAADYLSGVAWEREGKSDRARASFLRASGGRANDDLNFDPMAFALRAEAAARAGDTSRANEIRQQLNNLGIRPLIAHRLGAT